MPDQARKQSGDGAVDRRDKGQEAVLYGYVGVGHNAGNGDEAAENKKQSRADAGGNDGFYRKVFHCYPPFHIE